MRTPSSWSLVTSKPESRGSAGSNRRVLLPLPRLSAAPNASAEAQACRSTDAISGPHSSVGQLVILAGRESMLRTQPYERLPAVKGIIFTTFEDFVSDSFGADVFEEILDGTKLETSEPFVGPGTYPASDLMALVGTTIARLGIPLDDALAAFGTYSFPKLAKGVPQLMVGLNTAREFFLSLESVIHTEVRKLDPEANPARFTVEETGESTLLLHYESPLGLFALVSGFIDGVAAWYGESVQHELVSTDRTNATFALTFSRPTEVRATPVMTSRV